MRLLVDGVFFQHSNSGIARVWRSLLPRLVQRGGIDVTLLDRGNAPALEGVRHIPFPSTHFRYCADDSILLQRMCDHLQADVFVSTYFTTPLSTPSLLMVHDMIPELFDFDMSHRAWMEKDTAICHALHYLCVSHNTAADLRTFYPEIAEDRITVAHNGVDDSVFRLRDEAEVRQWRERSGMKRDYFLFVGSRIQHKGYKNSALFFDALQGMKGADFDVLCVGGEEAIEPDVLRKLPRGVRCERIELSDDDLALAYAGAAALVYPSLYEGFGMPVAEAMACACPVITTRHGALAEVAGEAAQFVGGQDASEMRAAMAEVRLMQRREALRAQGLIQARRFSWDTMADALTGALRALHEETRRGRHDAFLREWRRIREIQASVDN